jgi:hypothetical protein
VKESPQEVGFFIGAFVGFLWLVYAGVRGGSHGYMGGLYWIFMIICGGIGWLIGSLISRLIGS